MLRVCLAARREPGTTGTSRYVTELVPHLEQRGCQVSTLDTRPTGRPARLLAAARSFGVDANTFLASYPPVLRWPPADVYHLSVQTYASALVFRPPPGPAIVTVHDIIPHLLRGSTLNAYRHPVHHWFDALALRGLRRAAALIADSEWTKRTLMDELHVPAIRVHVAPLGVDHRRFRPLPIPASFWQRHGLAPDRRYILYVGSEDPRKDLPTLWRAFARAHRDRPDTHLLKVGASHHPAERRRLMEIEQELGIGGAVRFLDQVAEDDLPLFYNAAAVCAMPSQYEGFGFSVLEAMACGTPVVCAAAAALPEVAGPVAQQFPPGDDTALAEAMAHVLRSADARARARALGPERARAYTWEAMATHVMSTYASVVMRAAPGAARAS